MLNMRALSIPAVAAFLWLAGCVVHEPRPTPGLFSEPVTIIGHRGAKGLAPENTMAAFRKAVALGVPFELDTMLARTGEPVVIHDYTVDRVTQGRKRARVESLSLSELRALDVGSFFSKQYAGERIPTLAEALRECAPRVRVDVEVKFEGPRDRAGQVAQAVVDVIRAGSFQDRVFVTAFNPHILEEFRKQSPELLRGQLYGTFVDSKIPYYQKVALRNLLLNRRADPDLLAVEDKLVNEDYVKKYRGLGYRILVWTVNEPERIRELTSWGVDGIITDFPDRALAIVKQTAPTASGGR